MNQLILSTKIGSRQEILQAYKQIYGQRKVKLLCAYNSAIDMMITEKDQDLMTIPIDDRMANRAHGVTETTNIRNYRFSKLDGHLQRLQQSAALVGMKLPLANDKIIEKLHELAGLAYQTLEEQQYPDIEKQVLVLRILVSSGSGDFGIYSVDKLSVLYALIYVFNMPLDKLQQGVKEYTLKELWTNPDYLANAKSINYLSNSIMADYSKNQGGYIGIKLDEDGNILEGAIANIAYVLNDGTFAYPPQSKTIRGTTIKDAIEIVKNQLIPNNMVTKITELELNINNVHDRCKELFFLQNEKVIPILQLDGRIIGNGQIGQICKFIQSQIKQTQISSGEIIKGFEQFS